jgi:hypothetical protein
MVNVVVGRKRTVQVSTNATFGIIDTSTPITLKNNPAVGGVTRLDKLTDVDASAETDKATLVYNASLDKYIVKQIDIDGGTF